MQRAKEIVTFWDVESYRIRIVQPGRSGSITTWSDIAGVLIFVFGGLGSKYGSCGLGFSEVPAYYAFITREKLLERLAPIFVLF